jgi:hypothetical protein
MQMLQLKFLYGENTMSFADVQVQYSKVLSWVLLSSILPVVAGILDVAPPSPNGIVAVTTIYELVIIFIGYTVMTKINFLKLRKILVISLAISLLFFLPYVGFLSVFIHETPNGTKVVSGYQCSPQAIKVFPEVCPFLGKKELKQANWEAEQLFNPVSIAIVKVSLVGLWLGFFLFISLACSSFAAHEVLLIDRNKKK